MAGEVGLLFDVADVLGMSIGLKGGTLHGYVEKNFSLSADWDDFILRPFVVDSLVELDAQNIEPVRAFVIVKVSGDLFLVLTSNYKAAGLAIDPRETRILVVDGSVNDWSVQAQTRHIDVLRPCYNQNSAFSRYKFYETMKDAVQAGYSYNRDTDYWEPIPLVDKQLKLYLHWRDKGTSSSTSARNTSEELGVPFGL